MFLFKNISSGKYKISIPTLLWFLLTFLSVLAEVGRGENGYHNYIVYKGSYLHTLNLQSMYFTNAHQLTYYFYGPVFGLMFAPFAWLPNYLGAIVWCLLNAYILWIAVKNLPVTENKKLVILLIALIDLLTSTHNVQINPMIGALVILSFVMVEKENDFWAAFFIVLGFLVKVYGLVGLIFFFNSKDKIKFILSFLFWLLVLFALPMLISSPAYIFNQYKEWLLSLKMKDVENALELNDGMQDISVMGMIRRIFNYPAFNQLLALVPAAILYFLPLARFRQIKQQTFQLLYLALSLITVVIFSSGAESPTYVIALSGVAIWYIAQPGYKNKLINGLLIFVLLLTSLSSTDLFPHFVQEFIRANSLKALPCLLVWFYILYQMLTLGFTNLSSYSSNNKATK